MLAISIFSFSPNVFCLSKTNFAILPDLNALKFGRSIVLSFGKQLRLYSGNERLNFLQAEKNIDLQERKAFANDNSNETNLTLSLTSPGF